MKKGVEIHTERPQDTKALRKHVIEAHLQLKEVFKLYFRLKPLIVFFHTIINHLSPAILTTHSLTIIGIWAVLAFKMLMDEGFL